MYMYMYNEIGVKSLRPRTGRALEPPWWHRPSRPAEQPRVALPIDLGRPRHPESPRVLESLN